ncbi:MAG: thioredoxin family protein [Syntrophaceae bacterium]
MEISILGPGCSSCGKLEEEVRKVLKSAGVSAEVKKVTEIKQILNSGVMRTPGLAINGKVKSFGRIPKAEEIKKWIEEAE